MNYAPIKFAENHPDADLRSVYARLAHKLRAAVGISGPDEPAWPKRNGTETEDGTVVWTQENL